MNTFIPRNVTARDAAIIFGVLAIIFACGVGGVVLITQVFRMSQRNAASATAIPSPTSAPAPTAVLQAFEAQPTPTPPLPTAEIVVPEPTHTPTRRAGEACYYSDARINQAATPIPDGAFSRYQGYRCDNGYWDIGTGDWVDKTGDWGKDGVLERAFTKFNRDGVEIDRMFFDLQGNRIPGPNK